MNLMVNNIRQMRECLGLTQTALSHEVGISRNALMAIESGKSMPRLNIAYKIAKVFGCLVYDLWRDVEFNPPCDIAFCGFYFDDNLGDFDDLEEPEVIK